MFDIYINFYKMDNNIINNETLLLSIPNNKQSPPINKPVVKSNEDAADNFSFSMEINSRYYDALLPMKTMFRVVYDGDVIFYGRVMNISTSTVYQTKNVICEGTLSFFKDTFYEGVQEKKRSNISVSEYYTRIINNHNVNTPNKSIIMGNIGVTLPSDIDKYEPTAWTQSSSLISNLASNYGGHMRIRYEGTTSYLDWYKYYTRDLGDGQRPSVTVGKNIIDLSTQSDNANIFTRLIPIGDSDGNGNTVYVDGYQYTDKNNVQHTHNTKYIPVTLMNTLYTDAQLNDEFHNASDYANSENEYGIIYTTMSFSDAKKQDKLWQLATKWIKDCYFGFVTSFSVKAVDMHAIGAAVPKILLGECIDVNYRTKIGNSIVNVSKKMVCNSVQYDLFNPENSSYSIAIPTDLLEYNKQNKKSSKQTTVSDNGRKKSIPRGSEDTDLTFGKVWRLIGAIDGNRAYTYENAAMSFYNNGELTGTVKLYDPSDIPSGESPLNHKDKWFEARVIGVITLDPLSPKKVCISADRGICAYNAGSLGIDMYAVTYWYSKKKGYKYEGKDPLKSDSDGNVYTTDDGTPEGDKTILFKPTVLAYPEYDPTRTYSVGAIVMHGGYIYSCKIAIQSPEAWNASHWKQYGSGTKGEVFVGYDVTSGATPTWKVKLNDAIQYNDADGNVQVASGFVTASDFHVREIPSFKTKIGIFDIVVAGKVEAEEISADLSEIRKLLGDQIVASTNVRSDKGYFSTTYIADCYVSRNLYFYYETPGGQAGHAKIQKCFNNFSFSESGGVITLAMSPADGSSSVTKSFNMASTQFYIDAVEAAYERGYEDGGGGGSADSIRLAGWGHRAADPGSSYNNLGNLATEIRTVMASSRGGYVIFYAYINGDTDHKRYYKIDLTA